MKRATGSSSRKVRARGPAVPRVLTARRVFGPLARLGRAERGRSAQAARERGLAGAAWRGDHAQGTGGEEEGEEERPEAAPDTVHEHTSERTDRPLQGLRRAREVVKRYSGVRSSTLY